MTVSLDLFFKTKVIKKVIKLANHMTKKVCAAGFYRGKSRAAGASAVNLKVQLSKHVSAQHSVSINVH